MLARRGEMSAPVTIRSVKEKCGDSARDPVLWDTKCRSGQGVVARTERMPTVSEVVIGSLENACPTWAARMKSVKNGTGTRRECREQPNYLSSGME
jgi:hypothetical protein